MTTPQPKLTSLELRLKQISEQRLRVAFISAIGSIVLAFGLVGHFIKPVHPWFGFLRDGETVQSLLMVGGMLLVVCLSRTVRLAVERNSVLRQMSKSPSSR